MVGTFSKNLFIWHSRRLRVRFLVIFLLPKIPFPEPPKRDRSEAGKEPNGRCGYWGQI
jgi:hypothetical protein